MWSWKIGPALATGNTIVMKTAESTPLSALVASGMPKTLEFLPVSSTSCLVTVLLVPKLPSTCVLRRLPLLVQLLLAARLWKWLLALILRRSLLNLVVKSPHIIFNDADLDTAVDVASLGIFTTLVKSALPVPVCMSKRKFMMKSLKD